MPKILCTLPNASENINGVTFVSHAKGMLSEDVSDDVAETFLSIPGYELVGSAAVAKPADDEAAKAAAAAEAAAAEAKAAERAAMVAEAEGLGVAVKNNWGESRLKAEIDAAKKAKAEADEKAQIDAAKKAEGEQA